MTASVLHSAQTSLPSTPGSSSSSALWSSTAEMQTSGYIRCLFVCARTTSAAENTEKTETAEYTAPRSSPNFPEKYAAPTHISSSNAALSAAGLRSSPPKNEVHNAPLYIRKAPRSPLPSIYSALQPPRSDTHHRPHSGKKQETEDRAVPCVYAWQYTARNHYRLRRPRPKAFPGKITAGLPKYTMIRSVSSSS